MSRFNARKEAEFEDPLMKYVTRQEPRHMVILVACKGNISWDTEASLIASTLEQDCENTSLSLLLKEMVQRIKIQNVLCLVNSYYQQA